MVGPTAKLAHLFASFPCLVMQRLSKWDQLGYLSLFIAFFFVAAWAALQYSECGGKELAEGGAHWWHRFRCIFYFASLRIERCPLTRPPCPPTQPCSPARQAIVSSYMQQNFGTSILNNARHMIRRSIS